jgi:hypothetical protein
MAALQPALEVVEAAEKPAAGTQAVGLEAPVERDIGQEGDSGVPKSSPTAESSKAPPRAPAPKLPVAPALGSGRSSDRISDDEDVGSTSSGSKSAKAQSAQGVPPFCCAVSADGFVRRRV